jgi:hypothetical protein
LHPIVHPVDRGGLAFSSVEHQQLRAIGVFDIGHPFLFVGKGSLVDLRISIVASAISLNYREESQSG